MARAIPTMPRKSVLQKRSQATVETLLDATARVLTREGYDRASTNRIAAEQVPRMGQLAEIEGLQHEIFLLIRACLEECQNEISIPRPRSA